MSIPSLYFFILLSSSFFLSCTTDSSIENDLVFPNFEDTVVVEVGFPHRIKSFDFEDNSYIYCYDLITYKKVKLYDQDFNWIKSFSLDLFSDLGLFLSDIEMITPDSLLLLTDNKANTLLSLNTETGKTQKLTLSKLARVNDINLPIEFHASLFGDFKFNNNILFRMTPSLSGISVNYPDEDYLGGVKVFDSISKLMPMFLSIDDPFVTPKVHFIEKSPSFKESLEKRLEYFQAICFEGDNEIIHVSSNIPYLDIYNLENSTTKKVEIKSQYTDVSIPFRKWKDIQESPSILYDDLQRSDMANAGKVMRVYFDAKNYKYHVFINYSKKKRPLHESEIEPFIWQVYDKNFQLLDEREHVNCDMNFIEMFSTKKHLYLLSYDEDNYDPEKAVLLRYAL